MKIHTARQWTSLALIAGFTMAVGAGLASHSFDTFWLWWCSVANIVFVSAGAVWWLGFERPTASESTGTETN